MSRLADELHRVFGDPPVAPRAVMRVQVASGQGLAAGRQEADRFVDAGADLVVLDSDAASPTGLAAIAALLGLEPVGVIGLTATPGWADRVVALRTLLLAARPHLDDPAAMLAALGDPALGRQTGLLAQLATRHTPVLLGGGTDTAAAALLAARLVPGAQRWWIAGSAPVEPAGLAALTSLGLTPLLDLGLRTGGADVAVAVLRTGLEQLGA